MINQQQQHYIPILLAFSIGLLFGVSLSHIRGNDIYRDINSREDNNDHNKFQHRQLLSEFGLSTQSLRDPKSISARDIQPLVRDVHVGTMCRCPSNSMPVPGQMSVENGIDTNIHQPPSLATGNQYNHYIMHPPTTEENGGCTCIQDSIYAETSTDEYLKQISQDFYNDRCPASEQAYVSNYNWNTMPDFGVEESLPVFLGVLSYESPLSLNGTVRVLYSMTCLEWYYVFCSHLMHTFHLLIGDQISY